MNIESGFMNNYLARKRKKPFESRWGSKSHGEFESHAV